MSTKTRLKEKPESGPDTFANKGPAGEGEREVMIDASDGRFLNQVKSLDEAYHQHFAKRCP